MASNPYGLKEGAIEEHVEYRPDRMAANGMVPGISVGEPEQVWEEYGLEILPVLHNNDDIGQRWIQRNGEFVASVTDQYRLLPNEHAVETANEVADELGAVPFSEFGGDWFIKLDEHVFQDEEGRRAHALYAWDDPVDIDGSGDEVQLGFAIHNSIDGSMGFRVGLFTFRHACANMVFMGIDREGMNFDQRDVLRHSSQKHTQSLDVENLHAWIEDTVGWGEVVIDAYQTWTEHRPSASAIEDLLMRAQRGYLSVQRDLPGWMQDALESLEEAEERAAENQQLIGEQYEGGLPPEARANLIEASMPEAETVWDVYNDLTEYIWHNPSTNDQSKMQKMKHVHRVLDPSATSAEVTIR